VTYCYKEHAEVNFSLSTQRGAFSQTHNFVILTAVCADFWHLYRTSFKSENEQEDILDQRVHDIGFSRNSINLAPELPGPNFIEIWVNCNKIGNMLRSNFLTCSYNHCCSGETERIRVATTVFRHNQYINCVQNFQTETRSVPRHGSTTGHDKTQEVS
jgi:hypothetical protein